MPRKAEVMTGGKLTVIETLVMPLAMLQPYADNPRVGDIEIIQQSVRAHGQYRPLVVNRRTTEEDPGAVYTVLAGNHLLHALLAEGYTEGLVSLVDVDDVEAARIVLVDNRASDLGRYDNGLLVSLLSNLPDLGGTGYNDRDLKNLTREVDRASQAEPQLEGMIFQVVVICGDEEEQRQVLDRLKAEGLNVKAVIA